MAIERHSRSRRPVTICRLASMFLLCAAWSVMTTSVAQAQSRPVHSLYPAHRFPGTTASIQHRSRPDIAGYMQPVRVQAPASATVSIATDGAFADSLSSSNALLVGVLIGPAYRLRVTFAGSPSGELVELYPTLEVIDRLYPPAGQAARFPIHVGISEDDLRQASAGHLVTKVIYLENPQDAVAQQDRLDDQRWFETLPFEDPLRVADDLGKPMAILRIGSRTLGPGEADDAFLFGSPPAELLAAPVISADDEAAMALEQSMHGIPHCPPGVDCWPQDGQLVGGAPHWPAHPYEYLCDGGDGEIPIRARTAAAAAPPGLEPEDTVAWYSGRDGQTRVVASNCVCVYSPRFAATRRVTRVHVGDDYQSAAAASMPALLEMAIRQAPPLGVDQPQPVVGRVKTDLVTPLVDNDVPDELALRHPIHELVYDYQVFEDFQVVRIGVWEATERWAMVEYLDAAAVWTINEAAQVTVEDQSAYELVRDELAGDVYAFRDPDGPKLRLIKLASTKAAQPGDTVDFTIRFDNVGHSEARDVVIVDNLTTRLEYVPDSAQCTHRAEFTTAANEGESLVLTWRLTEPVAAGRGGVIRFRCKVR